MKSPPTMDDSGRPQGVRNNRRHGSVLVPAVAAMLLLSLCGTALAELFGALRLRGALDFEASRAFWIGEAGLRHAARKGAEIPSPIRFAGGQYIVSKAGHTFTATGTISEAKRVVSMAFAGAGASTPTEPLDEEASVASMLRTGLDKFEIDLVSDSPTAAILAAFAVSADTPAELQRLKLAGKEIWSLGGGVSLPTPVLVFNAGQLHERVIWAGDAPRLEVDFRRRAYGTVTYRLVLYFTNGTSSTLAFKVDW